MTLRKRTKIHPSGDVSKRCCDRCRDLLRATFVALLTTFMSGVMLHSSVHALQGASHDHGREDAVPLRRNWTPVSGCRPHPPTLEHHPPRSTLMNAAYDHVLLLIDLVCFLIIVKVHPNSNDWEGIQMWSMLHPPLSICRHGKDGPTGLSLVPQTKFSV